MQTLKDILALDVETVFLNTDEFAEEVIYDDGLTQKTVIALFEFDQSSGDKPKDSAIIFLRKTDVPAPDYRHTILANGKTWYMFRDSSKSSVGIEENGIWKILVTANERYKFRI